MDFKTKRSNKKLAKISYVLAMLLIASFFIELFILAISKTKIENTIVNYSMVFSPLLFAMISFVIYAHASNELNSYKYKIKKYRERKFFMEIINSVIAGNLDHAICLHRSSLHNHELKLFSKGFIRSAQFHSKDHADVINAKNGIKEMFEFYNPDDIIF